MGPDPLRILRAQHDQLRRGVRQVATRAPAPERLRPLAARLESHLALEERTLFAFWEGILGQRRAIAVLRADHRALRLAAGRALREGGLLGAARLSRQLEAHFAREERVLFPLTIARLTPTQLVEFGRLLRAPRDRGPATARKRRL